MDRSKSFRKLRRTVTTYPDGSQDESEAFQTDWSESFSQPVNNSSGDKVTPNSYEFIHVTNEWVGGSQERSKANGNPRRVDVFGPTGTTVPLPGFDEFPANLYNEALSKLFDKLRGDIDLSVDLAQSGQVASMVSSARKTLQYVASFRKGRWAEAYREFRRDGNHAKRIGSKWLEYQYGWKPLAQDCYNSVLELAKQFPTLMKIEVTAKSQRRDADVVPAQHDSSVSMRREFTELQRCKFKCRFAPPLSATQLLGNFTSLNPASMLWELTPYSFVFDWFLDVGGYIRNLETACAYGSTFRDGFVTEGYRADVSCNSFGSYVDDLGYLHTQSLRGSTKYSHGRRTRLGVMPIPRVPTFKMDLGSGRLLNAAALMSQHLGRH